MRAAALRSPGASRHHPSPRMGFNIDRDADYLRSKLSCHDAAAGSDRQVDEADIAFDQGAQTTIGTGSVPRRVSRMLRQHLRHTGGELLCVGDMQELIGPVRIGFRS
jgi:hypothetical protein